MVRQGVAKRRLRGGIAQKVKVNESLLSARHIRREFRFEFLIVFIIGDDSGLALRALIRAEDLKAEEHYDDKYSGTYRDRDSGVNFVRH